MVNGTSSHWVSIQSVKIKQENVVLFPERLTTNSSTDNSVKLNTTSLINTIMSEHEIIFF